MQDQIDRSTDSNICSGSARSIWRPPGSTVPTCYGLRENVSTPSCKTYRIAEAVSISRRTVVRIRQRFCEKGLERALTGRPRPGQKRRLDERAEARLVAIARSDPPEGYPHWTLRLLADKMVELDYVDSVARETVRQSLKKTNSNRGRRRSGASLR